MEGGRVNKFTEELPASWKDFEPFLEKMEGKKLSSRQREALHRLMWRRLAESYSARGEWSLWKSNGGRVSEPPSFCFACAEGKYRAEEDGSRDWCAHCPLAWPGGLDCHHKSGLHCRWKNAVKNSPQETRLAMQIAALRWNGGRTPTSNDTPIKAAETAVRSINTALAELRCGEWSLSQRVYALARLGCEMWRGEKAAQGAKFCTEHSESVSAEVGAFFREQTQMARGAIAELWKELKWREEIEGFPDITEESAWHIRYALFSSIRSARRVTEDFDAVGGGLSTLVFWMANFPCQTRLFKACEKAIELHPRLIAAGDTWWSTPDGAKYIKEIRSISEEAREVADTAKWVLDLPVQMSGGTRFDAPPRRSAITAAFSTPLPAGG
jgi:hypothetical protein